MVTNIATRRTQSPVPLIPASTPAVGNQRNPSLIESSAPTLQDLLVEATWLEWREAALTPQIVTDLVSTDQTRAEFVEGARLLRLDAGGKHIKPQQLLIADVLNAGYKFNDILVPRRGTKTTSIEAVLVGRCALREDYAVGWTLATTGQKASERFKLDIVTPFDRLYPDAKDAPFKLDRGKGSMSARWPSHGSFFAVHSPVGDSFRSGGYDVVWVDEAGEADPEMGDDLRGAVLPTLDTRPGAQFIRSGTAATYGTGNLLYDGLQSPRGGKLAYQFPKATSDDELAAWEPTEEHPFGRVRELIEISHPGVASGLTTLDDVRDSFENMRKPGQFAREYGGIFGQVGESRGVLNAQSFVDAGQPGAPTPPERFAIAAMPSFTQGFSSIVAAWRDENGKACGYVLDHRKGTTWLADAAATLSRRHNTPIIYDSASGPMRMEVEAMSRMNPRPRLEPQTFNNVTAAAALLVKEVNNGNSVHWRQPALEGAAKIAIRRTAGAGSWAFGRPPRDTDADISALEAWSLALRWYDDNPQNALIAPIVTR